MELQKQAFINYDIRPLCPEKDAHRHFEMHKVLSTLTDAPDVGKHVFQTHLQSFCSQNQYMAGVFDNEKLVGTGSIVFEQKITHDKTWAAHIEDVAILPEYQHRGVGRALIAHLVTTSKKHDPPCYKVTLQCTTKNVPFYEKCDFSRQGIAMAMYF